MKKDRKTDFLIVRVTKEEKKKILYSAREQLWRVSKYIRHKLGLE